MTHSKSPTKIQVGILGATGMVGQRLVALLQNHPYFQIVFLGASDRSANKSYQEAATWRLGGTNPIPDMAVHRCEPSALPANTPIVFSALDSSVAYRIENEARLPQRWPKLPPRPLNFALPPPNIAPGSPKLEPRDHQSRSSDC